jgi:uncharacterized membrane protein YfcA
MWAQYKRTLIPTQLLIITVALILIYGVKDTTPTLVVVTVIVMELGSLLGAWWGARLKRKIEGRSEKLPLE